MYPISGGGSVVAPTTYPSGYIPPAGSQQIVSQQILQTQLAQALNPCGPIVIPGSPGTSAPPLWIVPPADTTIIAGDISTTTTTTEESAGISLQDLYNIKFPWWILAVIVLLFLMADLSRDQ